MARKNADIVRGLPAVEPERGPFQDEVNAEKDALRCGPADPATLASKYEDARASKAALQAEHDAAMRPLNVRVAALEQLIPGAFADHGVETLKTSGGHSVFVSPDVSTKVTDQDALRTWAVANGYERRLTLYAPVVASITKERLREGEATPAGVDVRAVLKVGFRKE